MAKYYRKIKYNPEKLHPQNIDRLSTSFVPANSDVLEIGCASGYLGKYLIESKNCKVTGVDINKEDIIEAKKNLNTVLVGDISDPGFVKDINKKFDVLFAQEVIFQISNPKKTLHLWKSLLKKNGLIIISAPNIAHWSIRKSLLGGKFEYGKYGILDEDNIRFFTIDSFTKLVIDSGYNLKEFKIDPVGGGYPRISKLLSNLSPGLFTYQMVIKASLSS